MKAKQWTLHQIDSFHSIKIIINLEFCGNSSGLKKTRTMPLPAGCQKKFDDNDMLPLYRPAYIRLDAVPALDWQNVPKLRKHYILTRDKKSTRFSYEAAIAKCKFRILVTTLENKCNTNVTLTLTLGLILTPDIILSLNLIPNLNSKTHSKP